MAHHHNLEIQKYLLFNRVASVVLLAWAVFDFVRTRKREKEDFAASPPGTEQTDPRWAPLAKEVFRKRGTLFR